MKHLGELAVSLGLAIRFGHQKVLSASMILYIGEFTLALPKNPFKELTAGVAANSLPIREGQCLGIGRKGSSGCGKRTFEKSRAYVRLDKRDLHALSHRV